MLLSDLDRHSAAKVHSMIPFSLSLLSVLAPLLTLSLNALGCGFVALPNQLDTWFGLLLLVFFYISRHLESISLVFLFLSAFLYLLCFCFLAAGSPSHPSTNLLPPSAHQKRWIPSVHTCQQEVEFSLFFFVAAHLVTLSF